MTSSGLSHRRDYLKRPIVCKASPPIPPTPSDFECDCRIEVSDDLPYEAGEDVEMSMLACSPEYELDLELEPIMSATEGGFGGAEPLPNCLGSSNVDWESPDEPGFYTVSFTVEYPGGEVCGASIIVHTTGEEDEEED